MCEILMQSLGKRDLLFQNCPPSSFKIFTTTIQNFFSSQNQITPPNSSLQITNYNLSSFQKISGPLGGGEEIEQ
jgi:hypothetical protein